MEIRVGVRNLIPVRWSIALLCCWECLKLTISQLPVTFHGYVYMDYNSDCRIYAARAYADIPTSVLNVLINIGVPAGGAAPVCENLPVGGQKREALEAMEFVA